MASLLSILTISQCFTPYIRLCCSAEAIPPAIADHSNEVDEEPIVPGIPPTIRDTLVFRADYNTPNISLSAEHCHGAGAVAALIEGYDKSERQFEYHRNDVTIEIPRLAGDLAPKRESVVWTIYYALETMTQGDNSFREAEFRLRARDDESEVLAIVRFKKRVKFRSQDDVVVGEEGGGGGVGDDSDFNKALDAANITSGVPGSWSPEWLQEWHQAGPGFHPATFYMALVTMPCVLVTLPGITPLREFDSLAYKYKIFVTDETQPPLVPRLISGAVLRMGYQALVFALQRTTQGENLGLLTLTLKLNKDGQEAATFVLRYPALDAQSTPQVAGAATPDIE